MTLRIEPELGIALDSSSPPQDLKERVKAAANTAKELEDHGLDLEPNKEDKDVTARISERDDKSYSTQVYYCMSVGATRMEEEKVVQIPCHEA